MKPDVAFIETHGIAREPFKGVVTLAEVGLDRTRQPVSPNSSQRTPQSNAGARTLEADAKALFFNDLHVLHAGIPSCKSVGMYIRENTSFFVYVYIHTCIGIYTQYILYAYMHLHTQGSEHARKRAIAALPQCISTHSSGHYGGSVAPLAPRERRSRAKARLRVRGAQAAGRRTCGPVRWDGEDEARRPTALDSGTIGLVRNRTQVGRRTSRILEMQLAPKPGFRADSGCQQVPDAQDASLMKDLQTCVNAARKCRCAGEKGGPREGSSCCSVGAVREGGEIGVSRRKASTREEYGAARFELEQGYVTANRGQRQGQAGCTRAQPRGCRDDRCWCRGGSLSHSDCGLERRAHCRPCWRELLAACLLPRGPLLLLCNRLYRLHRARSLLLVRPFGVSHRRRPQAHRSLHAV